MASETSFYIAGGTLRHDAPCYVERQADRDLYACLLKGEFCYVLTSRQMGKSSLMVRTATRLRQEGVAVATVDMTGLGQNLTVEQWYNGMLGRLGEELDLEAEIDTYWLDHERLSPLQRWLGALREVVLPALGGRGTTGSDPAPNAEQPTPPRLVIFVDEIDAVLSLPFSTNEFFAAIRECYNRRTRDPEFYRLTFCLLGVASPSDLIRDTRMTPFNIGRRIELADFTAAEAAPLAAGLIRTSPPTPPLPGEGRLAAPFPVPGQEERVSPPSLVGKGDGGLGPAQHLLRRILYWTGGHPYLTQRLCRAMAELGQQPPAPTPDPPPLRGGAGHPTPSDVDRLCQELFLTLRAQEQDDNLVFVRERLLRSEADPAGLLDLYARVLRGGTTGSRGSQVEMDDANQLVTILRLSGVTRVVEPRPFGLLPRSRVPASYLAVRNRIYEHVFDLRWVAQHMPDAELRRQQAAYRRGLVRAMALSAVIVAAMGGLLLKSIRETRRADRNAAIASANARAVRQQLGETEKERDRANRAAAAALKAQLAESTQRAKAEEASRDADAARQQAEENARKARTQQQRAQVAAQGEKQAALQARRLLALSQAERGVKRLEEGNGLGLLDLLEARRNAEAIPALKEAIATLWAGWHQAYAGRLVSAVGHDRDVLDMTFSPDGTRLATASEDRTVRLWDTRTWQLAAPPLPHDSAVRIVAFSPDGMLLATAAGNRARLWNAATGKPRSRPLQHDDRVMSVAFRPDGKLLASSSRDGTVRLWDTETGRPRGRPLRQDDNGVWIGFGPPPENLLVTATLRSVSLWNPTTGQPLSPLLRRDRPSSVDPALAFSRDGAVRAIASDRTVWLWDAAEHRFRNDLLLPPESVGSLALSPDGRLLATAGKSGRAVQWNTPAVQLWETSTGRRSVPPLLHPAGLEALAFGPPGSRLLVTRSRGVIRFWDTSTGRPYPEPPPAPGGVGAALALSPDGRTLATAAARKTVHLWRISAQPLCRQLPLSPPTFCTAFRGDDPVLATYSWDGLRLWSTDTGQLLNHPAGVPGNSPGAFSSGGQLLVRWEERSVSLWQGQSGQPHGRPLRLSRRVRYAALSSHGTVLATISPADTVQLWDTASSRPRGQSLRHQPTVGRLEFSPDESLLATAGGDSVRLWETATGRLHIPPIRLAGTPRWVAFSPDNRLLAIAAPQGGAVTLWSTATGQPYLHPLEHPAPVSSGAFSPDGELLATVTGENTVRLWDLTSGRLSGQPMLHPDLVQEVRFSPDGERLATASLSGARLWDVVTCQLVTRPLATREPVWEVQFGRKGSVLALRTDQTVYLWRLPAAPADLPTMRLLTETALGVAPGPVGSAEVLPWQALRRLRQDDQRSDAWIRSESDRAPRAVPNGSARSPVPHVPSRATAPGAILPVYSVRTP